MTEQSHEDGPSAKDLPISIVDIEIARQRVADVALVTPLVYSPHWSERADREVWFKCENLQRTGSFKLRGAANKILGTLEHHHPAGVVTASSGNHGAAVAYAARRSGLPCTVIVPEDVIGVKEAAIRGTGAEVVRRGTMSQERLELAQEIARDRGYLFVAPYDDPLVMAGQGTAGLEMLDQCPQVAAVFVPVGGGGLTSGIATAVKARRPQARVYAAEPEVANDTWLSLQAGRVVGIDAAPTAADGLRSSHPGLLTFPVLQHRVDGVVLVSEAAIRQAAASLVFEAKLVVEPSAAVSLAAFARMLRDDDPALADLPPDGPVVCVLSGGNIDPLLLAAWADECSRSQ